MRRDLFVVRITRLFAAVRSLAFLSAVTALSVGAANSQGAVASFNNRPSWLVAAGPISVTENFQSFAVDTPFRNNVFVALAGGMTLGEIGPVSETDANFIDVPPLVTGQTVNNTSDALIAVDMTGTPSSDTQVELRFSVPATAWGADFAHAHGGDIAAVDVISNTNALLGTISVTLDSQFLGFTTTAGEQVGKLRFHGLTTGGSGTREYFQIDEVAATLVSEPGSLGLGIFAAAVSTAMARSRRLSVKCVCAR